MNKNDLTNEIIDTECDEPVDEMGYRLDVDRRAFVQMLGAGLLVTVSAPLALAIANAVFDATGLRIRSMPIRGADIRQA